MIRSGSRFSHPIVHVLLVEEDADAVSATSALLSEIQECRLRVSTSFADAVLSILEKPPELILFTHGLSGRNSLEVFASIRNKYPSIQIIVILPTADHDLSDQYEKGGAADCISKDTNYLGALGLSIKQSLIQNFAASAGEKTPFLFEESTSSDGVASMLSALEPGETILHYRIIDAIGEGGMGEVYKAEDMKLGRTVAIKSLPVRIRKKDLARRRFLREAQSASKLNHSGIVIIHAIEEVDDFQFIVMEHVEGESLRTVLERGPLDLNRLLDIGYQIADALGAAHSAGLIHRDIKPANVMISSQDKVKILDFGLAQIVEKMDSEAATNSNLTEQGMIVGTLAYMSPEQLAGRPVDARTDIFSFGVLLYEMLHGQRPFRGSNSLQLMHSILNDNPEPPGSNPTNMAPDLDRILQKALVKDRENRYSTMKSMLDDLTKLKEGLKEPSQTKLQDSIAVLYFENLGGLEEQEYLRDGLTEDVITELSKLEKLRVFPRSAILAFRDKPVTAPDIGRRLNAFHVLAGSVRKAGNRVRVNAQLIRSDTGHTVWAERYDREMQNVFDLQDEIARALAAALSIKLTPTEDFAIGQKPAENPKAYDFYLRGRRLFRRGTRKDMETAAEMFQQAIILEPNFALAFAGLGHVCGRIHRYYDLNPQWMERGIEACEKALRIEPNLPEALSARAFLLYGHKEYEAAIRYARMALELKKDCEGAYFVLGLALNITDHVAETAGLVERAIEFNGDDYNVYLPYITAFSRLGDLEKRKSLMQQLFRVLQMHLEWAPENARARVLLSSHYADLGDVQKALNELSQALAYSPNDAATLYNAACTYGLLGLKTEALATLKKAVDNGYRHADTIARDTDFNCLHDVPEFHALLKHLSDSGSRNLK